MDWPPDDQLHSVWQNLSKDVDLRGTFALLVFSPLIHDLTRTNPRVDEHMIHSAVIDTILSISKRPEQYDPSRGRLAAYLRMSAAGDLKNLLKRESRHTQNRESGENLVELPDQNGNDDTDDERLPSLSDPMFADVLANFSAEEETVLRLMVDGERDTGVFATAAGVPAGDVKRIKDRIKARLKREVDRA